MQLFPLRTGILRAGDDLVAVLLKGASAQRFVVESGDIIVISSKVVATVEGAACNLSSLTASPEAKLWAERCGGEPTFRQAVLEETKRWNGRVLGSCENAMLTELRPHGMTQGVLLVPNAGLDQSNAPPGFAIGWPRDPVASARTIRRRLEEQMQQAVVLSDSCCRPGRLGVTAFALTVSGLDPIQSQIGIPDLFGKPLQMTQEAVADQLATAANLLMGNAAEGIPAVLIRDHGFSLSNYEGWVPGIDPEEDLFAGRV
jgi:coenzyme F420-0:L-glutamate ligase